MSIDLQEHQRKLVTLHMPMSVRTFNKLLDVVLAEWPHAVPVVDQDDETAVHILSAPTFAPAAQASRQ